MYSAGVERALRVALEAHTGQVRKGLEPVPYVVHPLHVSLMLSRFSVDEEVIVAALLHDVVEDCDGWTLARVEAEFGASVASVVGELTEDKTKSWAERKQAAIDHVPELSYAAATIKACDKLHNLESLLADLRRAEDPDAIWSRFKGGREGTVRMDQGLVEALAGRIDGRIAGALRGAVVKLVELARG